MKRLMGILLSLSLVPLSGCFAPEPQPQVTSAPAPAVVEPRKEAPPQPPEPVAEPQLPPQPEVAEEPPLPPAPIPAGVWLAKNDAGYTRYYEFHPESLTGTYRSLEYDLEISFSYDGSGADLTFRSESEEPPRSATLEMISPEEMILNWEHTLPEELALVEAESLDEFPFYTNTQLRELAVDHYSQNSGLTPDEMPQMVASITNEDNSVTVQLYDNLGDHNSTAAWYLLDRFTARGTEMISGEEIDLTTQPEELPPPSAEEEIGEDTEPVSPEEALSGEEAPEAPPYETLPESPAEEHSPNEETLA